MKTFFTILSIAFSSLAFSQGIQLSLSSDTLTLAPGQSQQVTININPSGGFNQQVFLYKTCSGNCTGLSLTFSSNPVSYPYAVTFTVNVGGNAIFAAHDFIIVGSNGPVSDSVIFHLEISPYSCAFTLLFSNMNAFQHLLANESGVWLGGGNWNSGVLGNYSGQGNIATWYNIPFSGNCNDMTEDSLHTIWLATNQGVAKFDGTFWAIFNTTNSIFTSNGFTSIAVDSMNNVWASTAPNPPNYNTGNGLYKFDGANWTHFDSLNNSLPTNIVHHLRFDRNGLLWAFFRDFTSYGEKIYTYDGINWTPKNWPDSCLPILAPTSISFDSQNNAWFGTGDDMPEDPYPEFGLIKYDGSTVEIWSDSVQKPLNHFKYDVNCNLLLADSLSPIPSAGIHKVFVDSMNRVWAATVQEDNGLGVVLLDGGSFMIFNPLNSLLSLPSVNDFCQRNDTIFLATCQSFYGSGPSSKLEAYACGNIINYASTEMKEEIRIFPNPSNGQFRLTIQDNLFSDSHIKIYALSGQLVYVLAVNNRDDIIQLDLPDGFYTFLLEQKDKRYAGKFVIQRN